MDYRVNLARPNAIIFCFREVLNNVMAGCDPLECPDYNAFWIILHSYITYVNVWLLQTRSTLPCF